MIIRTLREDRGWSQEQLAETSGVSVRTVQRIESGGRASLESLKCFAAVFETTIPDLRKDADMTDHDTPIESQEPTRKVPLENAPGLTDEDRAALKYARHLRKYDSWYDDKDGWDHEDRPDDPNLSGDENRVLKQVRRERNFYRSLGAYGITVGFLFLLNFMTSDYMWAVWPAMGMAIPLIFQAMHTFGNDRVLGDDWEREQVEKRLHKLSGRPARPQRR